MKRYILLFCLLLLLQGCLSGEAVGLFVGITRSKKENNIVERLNSECLRREGVGCIVLEKRGEGIAVGKDSLFIANARQVIRFDLKKKKIAILAGSNNWKLFYTSKDGYGQKAEFDYLKGIVLINDRLYLQESSNPRPRLLNIARGKVTTNKTIDPGKIPVSFKSMVSNGSYLYFIDNTEKRIVKIDVSSGKAAYIPVFDKKEKSLYIHSLATVGNFIYFSAYDHNDECLFMRLNLKSGQTNLIFQHYTLQTIFSDDMEKIPAKGKSLIVVASGIDGSVHLRIFDKEGRMILDKPEKELKNRNGAIERLKRQLAEANSEYYKDNMDIELADSVKLITGLPLSEYPVASEKCFEYHADLNRNLFHHKNIYVSGNAKYIYFNDACLNIRRFNIRTGKLDLLVRKPKLVNSISGMAASGKYLYILDKFRYANKKLVRRVDLKSGQTSYLAGVLEN